MNELLLAVLLGSFQPAWRDRPFDPWIVRAALPECADALVLVLQPDQWVAYDAETGAFLGARRCGPAPMVPESFQPWADAPVLLPAESGPRFTLQRGGERLTPDSRLLGVSVREGAPFLLHQLRFPDDLLVEVEERVECWRSGLSHELQPAVLLDRSFSLVSGNPGGPLSAHVLAPPGRTIVDGERWTSAGNAGDERSANGAEGPARAVAADLLAFDVQADGPVITWISVLSAPAPSLPAAWTTVEPQALGESGVAWRLLGPRPPFGWADGSDGARLLLGSGGAAFALSADGTALLRLAEGLADPVVPLPAGAGGGWAQGGRVVDLLPDADEDGRPDGWRLRDPDAPKLATPLAGPLSLSWGAGWVQLSRAPQGAEHGLLVTLASEEPAAPATEPWDSQADLAAGFEALPPAAWRGYGLEQLPDGWRMDGDALARMAPAGDIVSRQVFGDFELRCEWKLTAGGNSGIFFRASESEPTVYMSAPEMQVLDDGAYAGLDPRHGAGSNYGLHAAAAGALRPAGQWNQAVLRVQGQRVRQWQNGVLTVDYLLGSPDWEARVAASKFAAWPNYGRAAQGHLALQDHGDPVWYRNLRVKRLPAER